MDTQTQIDRLIELAIIQRSELKQLVEQLPQLREHLNAEVEKVFEETEPQLRAELEDWTMKQTSDKAAALGAALEAKITDLAKSLEISTQARYNAIIAEREENTRLAAQAEQKIAEHAASLPSAVKDIVTAELARFPRAGEIDQLRKEFAEPKSLNPRGKWQAGETYNKLDLVTINGDSYTSAIDGNKTRPTRSSADWTLVAARGTGGGGGPTSLTDLTAVPQNGELLIGNGSAFVNNTLTAGTGVTITNGAGTITIDASGAQELLTATVKNADSVAITKGQVVYLFGATGGFPSVKLANNTSDATSNKTFGVVSDTSIAPNGTGTVTCVGVVDGLNLAAFSDGDAVYLGATAGTFTATKPYAPNHLVFVGIIERANMGNGELYVRIQNGYELEELHNVQITTPPLAGSLLMYDATNSLWKANRLTGGTNIAVTNADTSVTLGLTGTVAVANGGTGVTTSTGTGSVVLSNTPTLTTPVIGAATGTSVTLTGNATASDLILGTSGPSAKSSIAARAARQGLVFDGTAGTTWAGFTPSSSDFTVAAWFSATSLAANNVIIDGTGPSSGFAFYVATDGSIRRLNRNAGTTETTAAGLVVTGKRYHIAYVRGAFYLNGVSVLTFTDTQNYNAALTRIGWSAGSDSFCTGFLSVIIYNRALTAAEVVSLYEAGVPSGADYNTASNTTFVTGFTQSGSITSFTANATSWSGTGTAYAEIYPTGAITSLTVGKRYRLVVGTVTGTISATGGVSGSALTSNTTYDFTATGTSVVFSTSTVGAIGITGISLTRLGLLLAPDAAQAGGGLTWYDTSGNAANITLPASGVSWNVPFAGYVTGPTTTNLTLAGGSSGASLVLGQGATAANATLSATGTGRVVTTPVLQIGSVYNVAGTLNTLATVGTLTLSDNVGFNLSNADGTRNLRASLFLDATNYRYGLQSVYSSASDFRFVIRQSGVDQLQVTQPGNVLIGTTTDGGQKLQVNGAATFAGAIAIGNTVNTVSPTSPNRTITMVIGGVTYYLHAKTTND